MPSQNYVALTGHAGRDAETRYLADGTAVTELSVAITERYRNAKGEDREETTWCQVQCWRGWAESMATVKKGDLIQLEGKLKQREWEDKKDGKKQTRTYIRASAIFNHGRKEQVPLVPQKRAEPEEISVPAPRDEDDDPLPF